MRVSLSDLIDRLSIVNLKLERGGAGNPKFMNERSECANAVQEYREEGYISYKVAEELYNELYRINGLIWDLEADIRGGLEGILGLDEVGARTLKIRDYNRERIKVKNKITEICGVGYEEVKINHLSQ